MTTGKVSVLFSSNIFFVLSLSTQILHLITKSLPEPPPHLYGQKLYEHYLFNPTQHNIHLQKRKQVQKGQETGRHQMITRQS